MTGRELGRVYFNGLSHTWEAVVVLWLFLQLLWLLFYHFLALLCWNFSVASFGTSILLSALPFLQLVDTELLNILRRAQLSERDWKLLWSCNSQGIWRPWSRSWGAAPSASACACVSHPLGVGAKGLWREASCWLLPERKKERNLCNL